MKALDRLAALAGIEPSYYDVWGNLNDAGEEVKCTLLNAMGFAVASEADIEASMQAHEQRSWRRPLEPVVFIDAERQPGTVAVTLPIDPAGATMNWTLTAEDGTLQQGRVNKDSLPVIAIYTIDDRLVERRGLQLPPALPEGYHQLTVTIEYADMTTLAGTATVVIAPRSCYGPDDAAAGTKMWGVAIQLYTLRSPTNWGMGDFGDLLKLVERLAREGASAVGLNPLHPLFPGNPAHISPYSPSSRCFLNSLYIDVTAVPEFAECSTAQTLVDSPAFQAELAELRAAEFVDYTGVAAHKYQVLEQLFAHFRRRHLDKPTARGKAFARFCTDMGPALERFALFDALYEHFHASNPNCWTWRDWPVAYQDPASPEVAVFVAGNHERIAYFKYLQWLADEQLGAAGRRARELGMAVGLYMDLAVGVNPGGGEAWSDQSMLISEASLGAPPDPLNRLGQNWGLAPVNPVALRERAYAPFIAALRSNMRHAGALRIDHVMGLLRLFWIAPEQPPTAGVYVHYPLEEMLHILALESRRHHCIVIGEDLGTVPEGFRDTMAAAQVLSYRVLYFERWPDGLFKRPDTHPEHSLVTVSTHDLPTLAGWWLGRDIDWRLRLELYPNEQVKLEDGANRPVDRRLLLDALLDADVIIHDTLPPQEPPVATTEFLVAVHRMLAHSKGRLMMIQLEDATGYEEQMNLPGTFDEHPNWRRKLPQNIDQLFTDEKLQAVLAVLQEERPAPVKDPTQEISLADFEPN